MRPDIVIFESDHFKVVLHGEVVHPTSVVGFQVHSPFIPTADQRFPDPFMPPRLTGSDIPANFVSFLCNRNDWYCDPVAEDAAKALAAVLRDTRVITYGSSMGGFAAMNLAGVLDADYFIALSPQVTVFHPFMGAIFDARYAQDIDPFVTRHDHLAAGELHDRKGVIFFDSHDALDVAHAGRAGALTRASLIDLPFMGHPVAEALNAIMPLRRILTIVVRGKLDVTAVRKRVAEGCRQLPEWQAAHPAHFAAFVAQSRSLGGNISGQALLNAARCLVLYRDHWPGGDWAGAMTQLRQVIAAKPQPWPPMAAWMRAEITRILASTDEPKAQETT